MKLVKMSIAVALLLSVGAHAVENVEVGGDAKLFYGTQSEALTGTSEGKMFDKDSSYADFGFALGVTADLMKDVKAGAKLQVISTLGMENDIASSSWSNGHLSDSGALNTTEWVSEAWLEGKLGNTTGQIGRLQLETPLVFTEKWSMDYNTFEAVTFSNVDIPDTTLVGIFAGQSNGFAADPGAAIGNVMSAGGVFKSLGSDGAYIVGVTNNSIKPLTAQGWYYGLPNTLDAFWLQADLDYEGFIAGAQYTSLSMEGGSDSDTAYALKLGYAFDDIATITAAYSSVDDKGDRGGVYNIATDGQVAGTASSLYTEFWWWFQTASATGAETMTLSAESSVAGVDLFLGLYSATIQPVGGSEDKVDEITLTLSKSFGPVDTSVALIHDMFDTDAPKAADYVDSITTAQLYFTYNF